MPEGDTILWAATRMRPVLEGHVPDEVRMPKGRPGALRGSPGRDRWPERLQGRTITSVDTHGKNLFLHFEGGLVLHSHLKMTGAWGVYAPDQRWGRSPGRAWIVLSRAGHEVVQFDGPVLELMTEDRARFDQQISALGPDLLAAEFDTDKFLARLRQDDPTRPISDAMLDQRTVAGIGNMWKSEGCWEASIDPWRAVREVSDAEAVSIIDATRPRMLLTGLKGPRHASPQIYRRVGQPCPRCGTSIRSRVQGESGRMTYWCPGCQR
jgi:endonuclease-8